MKPLEKLTNSANERFQLQNAANKRFQLHKPRKGAWTTKKKNCPPQKCQLNFAPLYILHCALYPLQFTLRALHLTPRTLHFTLYSLHPTLYTPHSTVCTLHFTLYSLHPTLYTLHSTLRAPTIPLHTLHIIAHSTLHCFQCLKFSTLCAPPRFALHSLHLYGNRGEMYKTVDIFNCFTNVLYMTKFMFVGFSHFLLFAKASRTSWLVVFCENSERLGVWGEVLPNRSVFPVPVGVQGVNWECFAGQCTRSQMGDGGYRFPLVREFGVKQVDKCQG